MNSIISVLISVFIFLQNIPLFWVPVLIVDAGEYVGEPSTRATGFLYGLAEPGVPSEAMTDSLDISSVSQKVIGGLQHPTGDADRLQYQLEECDYTVIYLQDAFDTWYYAWEEIGRMREEGTYDWKEYITEVYFPIVIEKVNAHKSTAYADKLVYCIYNECDNGVWFGNYVDGVAQYDETGRQNFYEAWKMTYDLVKSLDPDAVIGGPGFCDYETSKTEGFMKFCAENGCVPEVMIYHELSTWSIPDWQTHVDDYRRIEAENGIAELPIIVTEYGAMEDCGNPATMIHYICAIENSGTYGNMAFWRLSNNLNDTCADDNTPNSNWWLYRKYAQMSGNLLSVTVDSLKERHKHDGDWRLTYKGLAALNEEKTQIDIIAAGSENPRAVRITNLDKTNLGSKVDVLIECVYYNGLNTPVYSPVTVAQYTAENSGTLNINIPGIDTDSVYFITVTPHDENTVYYKNSNLPVRYEFENGRLLGDAYTYDSAYATTGEQYGLVGGIEKSGDGVRITVKAPVSGKYTLDIVYGKHNDSGVPEQRDYAKADLSIDGEKQTLMLSNTIKSEYTNLHSITVELSKGYHTLEFTHNDGTYVLDSLLMYRTEETAEISVLPDDSCGTAYLAVAPYDGWYEINGLGTETEICVDGIYSSVKSGSLLYLRRGLNEISLDTAADIALTKSSDCGYSASVSAENMLVSGGAELVTDKYGNTYVDSVSCEGGKAEFSIAVPESGEYRVTLCYANNAEGGVHSYNVDLIERYVTVTANGTQQDVYCRNTFSRFNFKTVTFTLPLNEGENTVTLTNSGSYRFNNTVSFAPQIKCITVNEAAA